MIIWFSLPWALSFQWFVFLEGQQAKLLLSYKKTGNLIYLLAAYPEISCKIALINVIMKTIYVKHIFKIY